MAIWQAVVRFFVNQSIPIYIVCAIGSLYHIIRLTQASSAGRRAVFGYEKELVSNVRTTSIGYLLLFIFAGLAVFGVNFQVAPQMDPIVFAPPTPTLDVFRLTSPTPVMTSTPIPGTPRPRTTPNLAATATLPADVLVQVDPAAAEEALSAAENGGPSAESTPIFFPEGGGCTPATNLVFPRPDSALFGPIEFIGTATASNFGGYQIELRGDGTANEWIDVLGGRQLTPIENEALGSVNVTPLDNGIYDLRLSVFDLLGDPVSRCTIQIRINNE